MNAATMDHMDPVDKLKIPQPQPEYRSNISAVHVAAVIVLLLAGSAYALNRYAEHRLGATIYRLTNRAIATDTPACEVVTIDGVRVLHCIQTVAQ